MLKGTDTRSGGGQGRGPRDAQRTGALLAAALGAVFIAVLGWYGLRGSPTQAPAPAAPQGPKARPANLATNDPESLQFGEGERIEIPIMDKKDQRRQVGLVRIDALDPLEPGHFAARKPDAWLYLND